MTRNDVTLRHEPEVGLHELAPLLQQGEWVIFVSDTPPPTSIPNPWSSDAAHELHTRLIDHDVEAFIASYHDDTEWIVVLPGSK